MLHSKLSLITYNGTIPNFIVELEFVIVVSVEPNKLTEHTARYGKELEKKSNLGPERKETTCGTGRPG